MAPDAALASVVSAILVIVGHQSIGAGIALRVALPAVAIAMVAGTDTVNNLLNSIPEVITRGLQVAGGFIVVVGYAMVIRSHLRLLPHQRHADSNRDTRGGYDGRQGRLDRTVRGVGDPIFRGTIRPVLAALVAKWTSVNMPPVISEYTNAAGDHVITTLQTIFDSLMPSIVPLLMTFACMKLLKAGMNPLLVIIGLFALGIVGYAIGLFA